MNPHAINLFNEEDAGPLAANPDGNRDEAGRDRRGIGFESRDRFGAVADESAQFGASRREQKGCRHVDHVLWSAETLTVDVDEP